MSPHETLFRLEATQSLERSVVDHTSLCRFTIWDFPGDYYALSVDDQAGVATSEHDGGTSSLAQTKQSIFGGSTSLLFVVDAQDEPYDHVLQSFTSAVTQALAVNPGICVEGTHKVTSFAGEFRIQLAIIQCAILFLLMPF